MMKKLFSLLLLLTILLSSCSSVTQNESSSCKLFYFTDSHNGEFVTVETTLTAETTEEAIKELYSKLCSPENEKHLSAIPKSITLTDSSFKDGTCYLTLSPSYSNLAPASRVSLNFVLVTTMSELPGVEAVSITANGTESVFKGENFVTETPPVYFDSHSVNLYFPSTDYREILTVEKTFAPVANKNFEASVAELLLDPPKDTNLISPFPKGTTINDARTENGVCILDVSSEFIISTPHDAEKEHAVITAIVDTLTELPNINSVKFLIDGKPGYGFTHYNLAEPITNIVKTEIVPEE